MAGKRGLGKGLGAIFGDIHETEKQNEEYLENINQEIESSQNSILKETTQEENKIKEGKEKNIKPTATIRGERNSKTDKKAGQISLMEYENLKGEPLKIKISYVEPNPNQPRKDFKQEELQELSDSIKQYGIIQPIIVKKKRENHYEIIAGERRWRAAQLCGLEEVPVIVKDFSEREAMEISIIENVQRTDLNPIEEAMGYRALMTEYGLKQEEVAMKVSKNRSTITNALRLLKLDERVQQMTMQGLISSGHARALLSIEDPELQKQVADEIVVKGLSVRSLEKYVKTLGKETTKKIEAIPEERDYNLFFKEYEENIRSILGTKVHINRKDKNKGRIEIDYYSPAELERIIELIRSIR